MKKLMKKIKSNKLISKLVAVLTICMVLLSSLSVSAFAADDEVSAANEETESITDVWTDVMNWITSSLTSAQGVFLSESFSSSYSVVLNSSDLVELVDDGTTIYSIRLPSMDFSSAVPGDQYNFEFFNDSFVLTYSPYPALGFETFSSSDNSIVLAYYTDPDAVFPGIDLFTWYLLMREPFSGSATLTSPFAFELPGSVSLTFLGTLAVIGVAIAIAFLLISVISRFLRLRG